MPFTIARSPIVSANAEAIFCPTADSALRRYVLSLAQKDPATPPPRGMNRFIHRPVITDGNALCRFLVYVDYPSSASSGHPFHEALTLLSKQDIQRILVPLEDESHLHAVVSIIRAFLLNEDEIDTEIQILLPDDTSFPFGIKDTEAAPSYMAAPSCSAEHAPYPRKACMPEASPVPKQNAGFHGPRRTSVQPRRAASRPASEAEMEKLLRDFRKTQNTGESFHDMLLRLIDETDETDAEIYKRANISRQLFSKIRSNRNYQPGKNTIFAFAFALHLTIPETTLLLASAGYAFSPSSPTDRAVQLCMSREIYDIGDVNELLFQLDLKGLGA